MKVIFSVRYMKLKCVFFYVISLLDFVVVVVSFRFGSRMQEARKIKIKLIVDNIICHKFSIYIE